MNLRLVHTADTHGTQAVYHELGDEVDPRRDVLLDAGDALVGSNTAFQRSEPNLLLMSRLGYDAMTMGNRELHYLPWVMEQRDEERDFPLLAANLVDLWGRPRTWQEGVTIERCGLKIGVFGMTVVQYPVGSFYEKMFGLRFLPPETLIESLVERYQAHHDLVVFLSHLGAAEDRKILARLETRPELKLDFLLGGHSHVTFREPEKWGHTWFHHIGSHSHGFSVWERKNEGWKHVFHTMEQDR